MTVDVDLMHFISKVLKFIWAIWGLLFTIITLIIVTPLYFLIFLVLKDKGKNLAHQLSRVWAYVLFAGFCIRIITFGREQLSENESYVVVANHNSQLDIPACAVAMKNHFQFLAKEELTKIPLLGYIIKNLYLTVGRNNMRDRIRSLEKMNKALNAGISIMIYPEGTRNTTNQFVKPFFDGAFRTAIEARKDIAVLTIVNTRKLLPVGQGFQFRPGKVYCYWDGPISTTSLTVEDIPQLKKRITEIIEGHLKKHNQK